MRVSTDKIDSGYKAYIDITSRGYQVNVRLDGVLQGSCLTADDEEGYVLKASLPIRAENGEIVKEELYGNVEIIEVK